MQRRRRPLSFRRGRESAGSIGARACRDPSAVALAAAIEASCGMVTARFKQPAQVGGQPAMADSSSPGSSRILLEPPSAGRRQARRSTSSLIGAEFDPRSDEGGASLEHRRFATSRESPPAGESLRVRWRESAGGGLALARRARVICASRSGRQLGLEPSDDALGHSRAIVLPDQHRHIGAGEFA